MIYFIMDYCCGGDICSLLCSVGYLAEAEAVFYITQVILAVSYLHKKNIIHRDIKPENMLITERGTVKLSDFGMSAFSRASRKLSLSGTPGQIRSFKEDLVFNVPMLNTETPAVVSKNQTFRNEAPPPFSLDESSDEVESMEMGTPPPQPAEEKCRRRSTRSPMMTPRRKSRAGECNFIQSKRLGSPDYMSPELIKHEKVCPRSDCWSIGVCYFEFLVGLTPFNDETPAAVFQNIISSKIDWPEMDEDGADPISVESKSFIKQLLHQNPSRRPISANIFDIDLFHAVFDAELGQIEQQILQFEPPFVPKVSATDDIGYFMAKNNDKNFNIPD